MSGKPELIERFGADDCIGCWAGTEPDHGSDVIYYMNRPGVEPAGSAELHRAQGRRLLRR